MPKPETSSEQKEAVEKLGKQLSAKKEKLKGAEQELVKVREKLSRVNLQLSVAERLVSRLEKTTSHSMIAPWFGFGFIHQKLSGKSLDISQHKQFIEWDPLQEIKVSCIFTFMSQKQTKTELSDWNPELTDTKKQNNLNDIIQIIPEISLPE